MNGRSTSPGSLAAISVAILALAGCGGSIDDTGGGGVTPSTTTDVTIKAIDGVLRNALVCMDKNLNAGATERRRKSKAAPMRTASSRWPSRTPTSASFRSWPWSAPMPSTTASR